VRRAAFQMKHSFEAFSAGAILRAYAVNIKVDFILRVKRFLRSPNATIKTFSSLTPKKFDSKGPRPFQDLSTLSAPPIGLAIGFVNTIDRFRATSLTYPTTFANVGETSPTH